jgi:hypothetical protein
MSIFDDYKVNRAALWAAMDAIGATRAEVEFSGGNDEGGADAVRVYRGEAELVERDVPSDLDNLLTDLPHEKYYTFAGDFEVCGTVTVDRAKQSVEFHGHERVWQDF